MRLLSILSVLLIGFSIAGAGHGVVPHNYSGMTAKAYSQEDTLVKSDTMITSDSISGFWASRLVLDVAGLDSASIILDRKIFTGAWTPVGDTITASGQYDRSTATPGSYFRVRIFSKNDPGVIVRYLMCTY